jgi:hypothetical protein
MTYMLIYVEINLLVKTLVDYHDKHQHKQPKQHPMQFDYFYIINDSENRI